MPKREDSKPPENYRLTIFKINGHDTFRAVLGAGEGSFEKQVKNPGGGINLTEGSKREYVIDRITGELREVKLVDTYVVPR